MDWSPFAVCPDSSRPPNPRGPTTPEGLGDRLRTAAFAERQARDAFAWAAERFGAERPDLRKTWLALSEEEERHMRMLLERMAELDIAPDERPVSDGLWRSLQRCRTAEEFAAFIARAEERGRAAELAFERMLRSRDPKTADVFASIARDEERHIALAGGR